MSSKNQAGCFQTSIKGVVVIMPFKMSGQSRDNHCHQHPIMKTTSYESDSTTHIIISLCGIRE